MLKLDPLWSDLGLIVSIVIGLDRGGYCGGAVEEDC